MSSISQNDLVLVKDISPPLLKYMFETGPDDLNPIGKIGSVVRLGTPRGVYVVEVTGVQLSFTRDQLEVVFTT